MAKILIVDDDPQLRQSFEKLLVDEEHELITAATGEQGVAVVQSQNVDLVIQDVRLPGMDGLETFRRMKAIQPKLPVIIMTAYSTTETAITATRLGAHDYVLKPFDIPAMLGLIDKALEAGRFMRNTVALGRSESDETLDVIVGSSPQMQDLYKAIGRAAGAEATVLIRGESGTGKELVARALYQHSLRANQPFLVINCVAIPETLLESELFGYEKGAFTGAHSRRVGKIEQANRGTIFLDEIGDMPLPIQAKVLRLLQERQIERLGGSGVFPVDVRIIAATNRNLEEAVAVGAFREDLYYRLNVVTLRLPPLRERMGDVPRLADYFLERKAREMGIPKPAILPEAMALLQAHHWPGNVRELANVMQKARIFNQGLPLGPTEISHAISGLSFPGQEQAASLEEAEKAIRAWARDCFLASAGSAFDNCLDKVSALIIAEALELTGGNRTRAARLLGLSRPTLIARIAKYGLKMETQVTDEGS